MKKKISRYISPTKLSEALGGAVTRQTIIKWIHDEKIKATRIGNLFKIETSVAEKLVAKAAAGKPIP